MHNNESYMVVVTEDIEKGMQSRSLKGIYSSYSIAEFIASKCAKNGVVSIEKTNNKVDYTKENRVIDFIKRKKRTHDKNK